jgi:hypothetical protein
MVSGLSFFAPMMLGQCLPMPETTCNIDCASCNVTTCEQSEVGRCVWEEKNTGYLKPQPGKQHESAEGQCFGPSDVMTLLKANCPNGTYNDLATLFLADREGVISKLMRMKIHPHTFCTPTIPNTDPTFSEPSLVLFLLGNFGCILLSFGLAVPSGLFMPSIMTGATFGALLGTQMRKVPTSRPLGSASQIVRGRALRSLRSARSLV